MKVFIPHHKLTNNVYMDEIISYSKFNFIFGNYLEYNESYKIVNIQFPEAIFDWKQPSQEQLKVLESNIQFWKQKSKIVFTMNDLKKHYDQEHKFLALFKLLHRYADGVIHLGNYSLMNYHSLFNKDCEHVVIYHPLYNSLLNENDEKANFQETYSIDFKNKYVVSVIGCIRSKEEVRLILKAFKKIPVKNKFLVVPNMISLVDISNFRPYSFRKVYKEICERLICFPLSKKQYFFGNKFIDYGYMVDLVKKSSLILIPRIKNLNSGNLYLGLTFDKPMMIPKIGNLTEVAQKFGFPLLDLEEENFEQIFSRITTKEFTNVFLSNEYLTKKESFNPKNIAQAYESFFKKLID